MFKLSSDHLANFRSIGALLETFKGWINDLRLRIGNTEDRLDVLEATPSGGGITLPIDATDVDYDNATSGLTATDVQAAIDELAAGGSGDPSDTLADYILSLSPTGYWKCDETSGTTIADYGSANVDLTLGAAYDVAYGTLVSGSTKEFTKFGAPDGNASATSGMGLTYPLTGDWTVTWIAGAVDAAAAYHRVLTIGGASSSGASADNYQLQVGIDNARNACYAYWEYGSSSSELNTINFGLSTTDYASRWAVAIVKDGTANTLTGYLNGIKIGSVSYANEPSDGSGTMYVTIGAPTSLTTKGGIIGHVAFFNGTKLTDAQVANIARLAGRD